MIKILRPDDWHVHFRNNDIAETVVPHHSVFNRCMIMPNVPPIMCSNDAARYQKELKAIAKKHKLDTEYIMSIMLSEKEPLEYFDPEFYKVCKLYPRGVTTGSEHGVMNIRNMAKTFEKMQAKDLILSIHAEDPENKDILTREESYLSKHVGWVVKTFPGLRVIVEHVSSAFGVSFIQSQHNNVAGTITAHHLELTYSDTYGQNHNVCCPCPKSSKDQEELIHAATYDRKFFFGSDSAPHLKHTKECAKSTYGVFVPGLIALNSLIDQFYPNVMNNMKHFEQFIAIRGANFYKLPVTDKTITLVEKEWIVPNEIDGIVPYKYGQQMKWSIQ